MREKALTTAVSALGIVAVVALIAALASFISRPGLVRAHTADEAALRALTVTPGTLYPAFSSTVYFYTVPVADSVTQITVAGAPDGDGVVAYQETDATTLADGDPNTGGQQVDIPTEGKRFDVLVTHTDGATTTTQTYGVLVIRDGPAAQDTIGLMALYNSTAGPDWTENTDWGSTVAIGDWFQVNTNTDGRVSYLGVWNNNLVGTLPRELGNLDQLVDLYLDRNQLSGPIPSSLGNLAQLQYLNLWGNQLSGPIPDSFGNFSQLLYLRLYGNQLSGPIPSSLGNLGQLTNMILYDNELSGSIPASLGNLGELLELHLNNNELSGRIPASLGDLTKLVTLQLDANQLEGAIPASLGGLPNLEYLELQGNQLTGEIPASLGDLASLLQLILWGNQLTGEIPGSLGKLTNLTQLSLSANELSGPIPDLATLTGMRYLYLSENQLTGAIPAWLGDFTGLFVLYLWGNELSGSIPPSLGKLTNLTELSLSGNQLSGTIPEELGSLTGLQALYLNANQLTGPIPAWLGDFTGLFYLYLWGNELSGPIPDLSALTNLQRLYLSQNRLSGPIPAWLRNLTGLQHLGLQDNALDGPIPDLRRLTNLQELSIARNQVTGSIPSWLGDLTNLQGLWLWGNQLSGAIPASLGSLSQLTGLSVRQNELTGEIPPELGNLTQLTVAGFARNELTGCVPPGLRYLLNAPDQPSGAPPHDFIAVDANGDGDTDDPDDTPGLSLPFCMLNALAFSGVTLDPSFASGTAVYTADVANTVESTTLTATLADAAAGDRLSIRKGANTYANGDEVPLDVGSNEITIEVTPSNSALLKQTYTVQVFRDGSEASDADALMALYNSTGGASWTDGTNWGSSTEPLDDWYGVTASGGRVTGLDLSSNNLRGNLPAELGGLTELTTLDLGDNRLRGMLPDLRALTRLQDLHLGDNQLSGSIPDWLDSLTQLQELSLRGNQLTGTIPEELGSLTQLDLLHLSRNRLTGPIPEALGALNGLATARFAGNALTGCVPDGLRDLLTAPDLPIGVPAHDFIAVDANGDGDTADDGDTPGLNLPFCSLRSLTFSGATIEPDFASRTVAYTASVDHDVTSPAVSATAYNPVDTIAITKAADTYTSGDSVPLGVGSNVITIEVTTADGSPTPHSYTVTVTRRANTPPVFGEGATTTRGVAENTGAGVIIGAAVTATDADNDTLTYSLDAAGAESFDIDASTGQLRTKAALDYETGDSYRVTVSVSDGKDANSDADERTDDTISVTILVANVNEPPAFPAAADSRTIPENTAAGVNLGAPLMATDPDNDPLTYSLDRAGADAFHIDAASGRLQTKAALDYEDTPNYTLTVTATDPSGADDSVTVTITVENVNEAGTLTLSSPQPIVGTPLQATLTDPDDNVSGETWQWERPPGTPISGADTDTYTPVAGDVGRHLQATASYDDGEGSGKSARAASVHPVRTAVSGNNAPSFPSTVPRTLSVPEDTPAGMELGDPIEATDTDSGDALTYSLDDTSAEFFDIGTSTGQLRTRAALDFEDESSYTLTVTATDQSGVFDTVTVTIGVGNVEEPGTVALSSLQPQVGTTLTATLDDPDGDLSSITWAWQRSPNGTSSWTPIGGADTDTYKAVAADVGDYLRATAAYTDGEPSDKSALAVSANPVRGAPGARAPVFAEGASTTRSVARNTPAGENIGAPVRATDADNDSLSYSLGGPDAASFDIDTASGQLLTKGPTSGVRTTEYIVSVSVSDGKNEAGEPDPAIDTTISVTITVTAASRGSSGGGGGGGGGGGPPPIPIPSEVDFEWNVTRDIESLDRENDLPTGLWSDGQTLWVLENAAGGADAVFAYDLASGERQPELEFPLIARNRFSHGIWSDGETMWIADSGQDRLFAYELATGERVEQRDLELAEDNRDPRGIWSDGATLWVLDSVRDSLFAYDLTSGELLAEYPLDRLNRSPRGLWSDGLTLWASDDGAKRLFAYRVEAETLTRIEAEEFSFRPLLKAGNGQPRGIWGDGEVVYVVDEQDDHVYSYNLPDAADARLAELSLSEIEFGAFSSRTTQYGGSSTGGAATSTIAAAAVQEQAGVVIEPADADSDAENGHQVAITAGAEVTITVTSADASRSRVYRVRIESVESLIELDAGLSSFSWPGRDGVPIADALRGTGADDDISDKVIAIYEYDPATQTWRIFVTDPELANVPGLRTLTTLSNGSAYLISVTEPLTWTIVSAAPGLAATQPDG